MKPSRALLLLLSACTLLTGLSLLPPTADPVDWPTYGGNPAGNRYSALSQINTTNVNSLSLAWMFDTGESDKPGHRGSIQCQPIVVKGVMYATTPRLRLVAVDAATGWQRWSFDPFAGGKDPELHVIRGS